MAIEIKIAPTLSLVAPPRAQSLDEIQHVLAKLKAPRSWFEFKRYVILEENTLVCRSLHWSELFGYWKAGTTAKIADIANFYHRQDSPTPTELAELFTRYLARKVTRPDQFTSAEVCNAALLINEFHPGSIPENSTTRIATLLARALVNKQIEQAFTFFSRLPVDEQLTELALDGGVASLLTKEQVSKNRPLFEELCRQARIKKNEDAQHALFALLYPQKALLGRIEVELGDYGLEPDLPAARRSLALLEQGALDMEDRTRIINLITKVMADGALHLALDLFYVLPVGFILMHLPSNLPALLLNNIEFDMEYSITQLISGILTITDSSALRQTDWFLILGKALKTKQEKLARIISSKLPTSELLQMNTQFRIQLMGAMEKGWEVVVSNLLLKIPANAFEDDLETKQYLQGLKNKHLVTLSDEAALRLA